MCFDFGLISGPIIAGLTSLGGGSLGTGVVVAGTAAASLAATAVTAVGQSQAAKAQERASEYNADITDRAALDAQRRGSMAEAEHRTQSKRIIGAMRAGQGASGTVADTGSNLDVLAESAEYGGRNAALARIGGEREAFGFTSQENLDRYAARSSRALGTGRVVGTALAGTSRVFEQSSPWWTTWRRPSYGGTS